jgi:putative oxidoreductase
MNRLSISRSIGRLIGWLQHLPLAVPEVFFRLGVSLAFWRSGQTKIHSWSTTLALFSDEYKVPVLPPELAAYIATTVELTAPILLLFGFATRLGAAAMLGMTIVIQTFVYPQSYPTHLLWAGPLLYLVIRGPGVLSIDHLIRKGLLDGKDHSHSTAN